VNEGPVFASALFSFRSRRRNARHHDYLRFCGRPESGRFRDCLALHFSLFTHHFSMPMQINAARLWSDAEDRLIPALGLGPYARALYYHLLRATLLDGRRKLRRTTRQLARATAQSVTTAREHLRKLVRAGCIALVARTRHGLTITVRSPRAILRRGARRPAAWPHASSVAAKLPARAPNAFKNPRLRRTIFRREGGRCFYCRRRLRRGEWTLDHVVPRAAGGADDASNAVACCAECNVAKGSMRATDFLRTVRRRSG
jgi:hypothetical protein